MDANGRGSTFGKRLKLAVAVGSFSKFIRIEKDSTSAEIPVLARTLSRSSTRFLYDRKGVASVEKLRVYINMQI